MSTTNNKLVKVVNGFNSGGVLKLNFDAMLSSIRATLENQKPALMEADQFFIISGTPLTKSNEATTTLKTILTVPTSGEPVLTVGTGSVPIPGGTNWNAMTIAQQAAILNTGVEVTKGLSLSADQGLFKLTEAAIDAVASGGWTSDIPRIESAITTNSYFSKYASSLATSSANGGSVSVDTPFGGGSTSYEHAQSQEKSNSSVTTYSVGTYNVNKVEVVLDQTKFQLTSDFETALLAAVSLSDAASQFVGIVQALNKYGWYIPTRMMLGGVLLTSKQSESTSWSESQTTSDSFSADFKASFDGIGGGAAYNQSNKSGTTTSGSQGSASLSFTAIGGLAEDANDFSNWAKSLEPATAWSVSSYETMIPSLYVLYNMGTKNIEMLYAIKKMMEKQYSSSPELGTLQPLVDVGGYLTALNNLLPEFG